MSLHVDHAHGADRHSLHLAKTPYWKRAHHDWRFWVGLSLALVAMIIYVMSFDLALRPSRQMPPPEPGISGK